MTRALVILPLLLALLVTACAHQQRTAMPEFEPVTESENLDEGGGGYLPIPYYVEHAALGQAEPPVGSPSWLAQAYSLTLSAPSGANAIIFTSNGARLDLGTGTFDYLYSDGANIFTPGNLTINALGITVGVNDNGIGFNTDGARLDLGSGANDYFATDGVGNILTPTLLTAGSTRLSSTAALPTCAATIEGTFKRDGTTGAASTARTRVCLCTSDGAATPAYQWINAVSGTVGTATTCPL